MGVVSVFVLNVNWGLRNLNSSSFFDSFDLDFKEFLNKNPESCIKALCQIQILNNFSTDCK